MVVPVCVESTSFSENTVFIEWFSVLAAQAGDTHITVFSYSSVVVVLYTTQGGGPRRLTHTCNIVHTHAKETIDSSLFFSLCSRV